jgi:hypothetical protein
MNHKPYSFFRPVLAAIALGMLMVACSLGAPGSSISTTTEIPSTVSPATQAPVSLGDPAQAIMQAYADLKTESFRLHEDSLTQGTPAISRTVEFVPPDRRHSVLGTSESISIGTQSWDKQADGTWQAASPKNTAQTENQINDALAAGLANGSIKVTQLGGEDLNGTPTASYQIDGTLVIGQLSILLNGKVWLRTSDGHILKSDSLGTLGGVATKSTITYEYDPTIKIEAPLP